MAWNLRLRPSLGPLHLNISKRGVRSVSLTIGWFTKNLKSGRWSFDWPGPGSMSWGGRARRNRTRR